MPKQRHKMSIFITSLLYFHYYKKNVYKQFYNVLLNFQINGFSFVLLMMVQKYYNCKFSSKFNGHQLTFIQSKLNS